MMTRQDFLRTLLACPAFVALSCREKTIAMASRRPNIVLITVDDLDYESLGTTGCTIPGLTPHLDRLASQGVLFEHAHVTSAICQPSRSALMTGLYPHRNGATGFCPIKPKTPTLPSILKGAGYRTGILGKVEHLEPSESFPWDVAVNGVELGRGRDPQRFYEETQSFIRSAGESPFFLMANIEDPHRPFAHSAGEQRIFKGRDIPAAGITVDPARVPVPGFLPDLPEVREELAQYFASVRRCDRSTGEILRAVEESGRAADTLTIFLSDNGMAFPFAKTNCYRASTRTPCIVRWPDRARAGGVIRNAMISGVDFTPTILEAAGIAFPAEFDGGSFLPLLDKRHAENDAERDRVFTFIETTAAERDFHMRSVQTRKTAYIWNGWADGHTTFKNESQSGLTMTAMNKAAKKDPAVAARVELFLHRVPEEFYDYSTDPYALHNRIHDGDVQQPVESNRQALLKMMRDTGDPRLAEYESFMRKRGQNQP